MKTLKLFFVLIITMCLALNYSACYAIDLNLTDPLESTTANSDADNSIATNTNTSASNTSSNTSSENNTNSSNENNTVTSNNSTSNTTINSSASTESSNIPLTTVTTASSDELTLSDIINIFLAVIGIILILLGFAILVKTNKQ